MVHRVLRAGWRLVAGVAVIPAPYECAHRWLFIASERGRDRKSAYLCANCGTFRIAINGTRMNFQLPLDELVTAAGIYAERLKRSEQMGREPD